MAKKRHKMGVAAGIVVIVAVVIFVRMMINVKTYRYSTVDTVLRNPLIGFAPNADYFDAVGVNTLV